MVHRMAIIQRTTYRQRGTAGSRDSSREIPRSWRFAFSPTIPPDCPY